MPTILVRDGFHIRILLPPREHGPAHVHVYRAGGLAVIDLPEGRRKLSVRRVSNMRDTDVVRAVRLVEASLALLSSAWRKYHG